MDREGEAAVDPRDPNYDSGDDKTGVSYHLQLSVQIKMYKQSVRDRTSPLSFPCLLSCTVVGFAWHVEAMHTLPR